MSTPNPLPPPDALDGSSTPKSRMRVTVLTILALHVVFIGGLLMQGCDKKQGANPGQTTADGSTLPSLGDTNYFKSYPGDAPGVASSATTSTPSFSGIPPLGVESPSSSYASPTGAGTGAGTPTGTGAVTDSGAGSSTATGSGAPIGGLPLASSPTESAGFSGGGTAPPGAMTEHVIKRGDTIGALAVKYGVSIQAIIDANPGAKPRSLQLNDVLQIPPPAPRSASVSSEAPAAEDGTVYVVKQGDNLSKIAKQFGVTVKGLRTANNLRNDRIMPKQRLKIPTKAAERDPAPADNQPF